MNKISITVDLVSPLARCHVNGVPLPFFASPAGWAELGDVLIEHAAETEMTVVISPVFSEMLVLRLLRRVREEKLSPETLVVTVETKAGMVALPVTADGDFSARCPEGFFVERLEEMF